MSKQNTQTNNRRFKWLAVLLLITTITIISGTAYTNSQTTPLKLDPDFSYVLLAYNTSISSDTYLYCTEFGWNTENTSFLLTNTYLTNGLAISDLEVSIQNANMSFTSLGQNEASFTLTNFDEANITLIGFGREPSEITVDGAIFSNYTYTELTDGLQFATNGTQVIISFPGGLSGDDAVGIAIGFAVAVLAVCLVLIIVYNRRKQYDE